ncbi:hypothetical protein KIPE111705_20860 [Kibdelosporangium persicum]
MNSGLLDEWLDALRRARWTFYYFPNQESPRTVSGLYRWREAVDVFGLFPDGTGLAYRALPVEDPFSPDVVTWTFAGDPIWAIREVLALPPPGADGEPVWHQFAPPLCQVLSDLSTTNHVIRPPT